MISPALVFAPKLNLEDFFGGLIFLGVGGGGEGAYYRNFRDCSLFMPKGGAVFRVGGG